MGLGPDQMPRTGDEPGLPVVREGSGNEPGLGFGKQLQQCWPILMGSEKTMEEKRALVAPLLPAIARNFDRAAEIVAQLDFGPEQYGGVVGMTRGWMNPVADGGSQALNSLATFLMTGVGELTVLPGLREHIALNLLYRLKWSPPVDADPHQLLARGVVQLVRSHGEPRLGFEVVREIEDGVGRVGQVIGFGQRRQLQFLLIEVGEVMPQVREEAFTVLCRSIEDDDPNYLLNEGLEMVSEGWTMANMPPALLRRVVGGLGYVFERRTNGWYSKDTWLMNMFHLIAGAREDNRELVEMVVAQAGKKLSSLSVAADGVPVIYFQPIIDGVKLVMNLRQLTGVDDVEIPRLAIHVLGKLLKRKMGRGPELYLAMQEILHDENNDELRQIAKTWYNAGK